jgi:hypothetical protein
MMFSFVEKGVPLKIRYPNKDMYGMNLTYDGYVDEDEYNSI